MTIDILEKATRDINNTPIVQQTAFWSEVKTHQGLETKAFDFKVKNRDIYTNVGGHSYTNADLLLLQKPLDPQYSIAYVPYGPEIEPSEEYQGRFLEELSEIMRSYLPKSCIAIRYDLNWQSHWCDESYFDESGLWAGPPDKKFQEFNLNYNTIEWNLRKSNSDILPSTTVFLNLSLSEEEILTQMKPKTRYNIRLAEKKGVRVLQAGMDKISVWYELYKETALRNGLFINDIEYFVSVLTARADDTSSPAHVELLIAEHEGEPLAAIFLVMSGHRGTYLYGASSSQKRNYMPAYALQWEAVKIAKANGCTEYDMFGVSPGPDRSHPMYGLYQFKTGFGGELFHHLGCWDYLLDEENYRYLQISEMNAQGYYLS
ncbi:peptidoglycan bridge formation glycyltransferase FemA/FemB family protein [Dysgonomonas sp. GY75]|uniref:lipid II:glycine glycyltransferase FemX n=1 Tax=Dysgonomonas sp. GY75 TaxID=2780419 RepID=UPI0018840001|nr:peptidoglycan bridge formation glycyltransferase FemA/FemB family protein [Dysgonomonas sp. GY75]MBF0651698.1 peptidoglycan bridge formation glycyltransferase FemA/FemB family protein [Dysgonomonas sp. GY75]